MLLLMELFAGWFLPGFIIFFWEKEARPRKLLDKKKEWEAGSKIIRDMTVPGRFKKRRD
jgi:hypothetical protein